MSIFISSVLPIYLSACAFYRPWKLLSKAVTEEEKKEHSKIVRSLIFMTGLFFLEWILIESKHYFVEELGLPSFVVVAIFFLAFIIYTAALLFWENKKK